MRSFRLSPAAQLDLNEIWDYSETVWGTDQAEQYTRSLENAIRALAQGDRRGRPISEVKAGYFRLSVRSHVICYTLSPDAVDVIRILHGRMDIPSRLDET